MSQDCDLIQHRLAWDPGNLHRVALTLDYDGVPDLGRLAGGTVRLAVKHSDDYSHARLMFDRVAGPSYNLSLANIGISDVATLLGAAQTALGTVHTASLSHTGLKPLTAVLARMPRLEHLSMHVTPSTEQSGLGFDWAPLACLSDTARAVPGLRAITVQVWCGYHLELCYADEDDARGLIAQLRVLPNDLPPITIQGFPADEVSSINLSGLRAHFEFSATVGELFLWKRREEFYPFFGT